MGTVPFLLVVACLLQDYLARAVVPLLASSSICKINPTITTIALEKPYCFYISAANVRAYLYVVQADAPSKTIAQGNMYSSTQIGATAPYVAAMFENPNCSGIPTTSDIYDSTKVRSVLDKYVVRVGNDNVCFNPTNCNGPLKENTAYSFMYAFYNTTSTTPEFVSDWSPMITTKQAKPSAMIDTWPGGRSGGMIVITSILSTLLFFVLAGLVATIVTSIMTPSTNLPTTVYESRTSHAGPQKADTGVEFAADITVPERYSTTPQS